MVVVVEYGNTATAVTTNNNIILTTVNNVTITTANAAEVVVLVIAITTEIATTIGMTRQRICQRAEMRRTRAGSNDVSAVSSS